MTPQRIAILFGHPMPESFNTALGLAYAAGARAAGADVRELHLGRLTFDPLLHKGYTAIQPLEPDLLRAQEDIRWAEHLVVCFPIWWGVPPALLKGFIDRVFHPGWAFKYETRASLFQKRLLSGRSARLVCTMDSPPWYYRLVIGAPAIAKMKNSVFGFCGIRPVRATLVGSVRFSTPARRTRWLRQLTDLGRRRR